jgi:hypothetical protein
MNERPKKSRWFNFPPLPGRRRDYYLLFVAALDIVILQLTQSFDVVLGPGGRLFAIGFDIFVMTLWGLDLIGRTYKQENKLDYLKRHWYEVAGIVPFQILRFFLLLRGVKLAIVYYKLGRADEQFSRSLTREITFRFRDVIVDAIADAVFLQSLRRVEEVMLRLNYAELARRAFQNHQKELNAAVKKSLRSKSMMGELARLPFMQGFVERTGDDVSMIISEILETEVAGEIMKEITRGILVEMYERVQRLDVERITGDSEEQTSSEKRS